MLQNFIKSIDPIMPLGYQNFVKFGKNCHHQNQCCNKYKKFSKNLEKIVIIKINVATNT
jgi:hypothetical protein